MCSFMLVDDRCRLSIHLCNTRCIMLMVRFVVIGSFSCLICFMYVWLTVLRIRWNSYLFKHYLTFFVHASISILIHLFVFFTNLSICQFLNASIYQCSYLYIYISFINHEFLNFSIWICIYIPLSPAPLLMHHV